jgi:hypothetical protein
MNRPLTLFAICAAAGLAGCAKVGTLDRPAPLFGDKAKAQYRAEEQAAAKAKADEATRKKAEDLPSDTGDNPVIPTLRNQPVEGAKPSPFGTPPPPGPMPDPFNNPQ